MSIFASYHLQCDWPSCRAQAPEAHNTSLDASVTAAMSGWGVAVYLPFLLLPCSVDLCPEHLALYQREGWPREAKG